MALVPGNSISAALVILCKGTRDSQGFRTIRDELGITINQMYGRCPGMNRKDIDYKLELLRRHATRLLKKLLELEEDLGNSNSPDLSSSQLRVILQKYSDNVQLIERVVAYYVSSDYVLLEVSDFLNLLDYQIDWFLIMLNTITSKKRVIEHSTKE